MGCYTTEAIGTIAEALKASTSITSLVMYHNKLQADGIALLREAMRGRDDFELLCD